MVDKLLDAYIALGFGQRVHIAGKDYNYRDIAKLIKKDVVNYYDFELFVKRCFDENKN